MLQIIYNLFGEYTPITYPVTKYVWDAATEEYVTYNVDVIPNGVAGLDWPWVAGFVLFTVFFYSVLRIIGGVACGKL